MGLAAPWTCCCGTSMSLIGSRVLRLSAAPGLEGEALLNFN